MSLPRAALLTTWGLITGSSVYVALHQELLWNDVAGEVVANLEQSEGRVQYRPRAFAVWDDVMTRQNFFGGEIVATSEEAAAQIQFGAGRLVDVEENTQIAIDNQLQDDGSSSLVLTLLRGRIRVAGETPSATPRGGGRTLKIVAGETKIAMVAEDSGFEVERLLGKHDVVVHVTSGEVQAEHGDAAKPLLIQAGATATTFHEDSAVHAQQMAARAARPIMTVALTKLTPLGQQEQEKPGAAPRVIATTFKPSAENPPEPAPAVIEAPAPEAEPVTPEPQAEPEVVLAVAKPPKVLKAAPAPAPPPKTQEPVLAEPKSEPEPGAEPEPEVGPEIAMVGPAESEPVVEVEVYVPNKMRQTHTSVSARYGTPLLDGALVSKISYAGADLEIGSVHFGADFWPQAEDTIDDLEATFQSTRMELGYIFRRDFDVAQARVQVMPKLQATTLSADLPVTDEQGTSSRHLEMNNRLGYGASALGAIGSTRFSLAAAISYTLLAPQTDKITGTLSRGGLDGEFNVYTDPDGFVASLIAFTFAEKTKIDNPEAKGTSSDLNAVEFQQVYTGGGIRLGW